MNIDQDLLDTFIEESCEYLDSLDEGVTALEKTPHDRELVASIFRIIHSLKGSCGIFGFHRLERVTHCAEEILGKIRDGVLEARPDVLTPVLRSFDVVRMLVRHIRDERQEPAGNDEQILAALKKVVAEVPSQKPAAAMQGFGIFEDDPPQAPPPVVVETADATKEGALDQRTIRVALPVLDELMNLVGELVLSRNQLIELSKNDGQARDMASVHHLNRVTSRLQEAVMKTRMQPIGSTWGKFPRIVRDLQLSSGKRLELKTYGRETEIDRQILQVLSDPLVHCVRNAIDHGIELPADRVKAGKSAEGEVTLKAYQQGGHIVVEVADDGAGLNVERIRTKAVEKGLLDAASAANLSEAQVMRYIFEPGFSTASRITEVSGRGVGMDVVRSNVESIGGSVDLVSVFGRGTTIRIKIPLTLAIISALIVNVGGAEGDDFAIPQVAVLELVHVQADQRDQQIQNIHGARFLYLREQMLPLVDLGEVLGLNKAKAAASPEQKALDEDDIIVIVQANGRQFGLRVDRIHDTQEVVVKPVGRMAQEINIYSGTTILGDGRVIIILDVARIGEKVLQNAAGGDDKQPSHDAGTNAGKDSASLMIVKADPGPPLAIPLSVVARLEEFRRESLEQIGQHYVVQYRGELLPIMPVRAEMSRDEATVPAVICTDGRRQVGLWVSSIQDIVEQNIDTDCVHAREGVIGSIIVANHATEVLDPYYYMDQTFQTRVKDPRQSRGPLPHILLVDDSRFFLSLLRPLMESEGYRVTAAKDGRAALEALEAADSKVDLIVSDIEMPNMDGLALARAVRQSVSWQEVPMIALSSKASDEHRQRALDAGFNEYLTKFDRDVLSASIVKMLQDELSSEELAACQKPPKGEAGEKSPASAAGAELAVGVDEDRYVTFRVGQQLLGLRVEEVQEIIPPQRVAHIPLSSPHVAGLLNLRGHVITAVDLRHRLGFGPRKADADDYMNVVVRDADELFSIVVDNIGDVMTVPKNKMAPLPSTLSSVWKECSRGVCKLPEGLLVVLEKAKVLSLPDSESPH